LQIKKSLQLKTNKRKKGIKKRKWFSKKKINWQQGNNEFDRQDINGGKKFKSLWIKIKHQSNQLQIKSLRNLKWIKEKSDQKTKKVWQEEN
jgi:hypothetical protein